MIQKARAHLQKPEAPKVLKLPEQHCKCGHNQLKKNNERLRSTLKAERKSAQGVLGASRYDDRSTNERLGNVGIRPQESCWLQYAARSLRALFFNCECSVSLSDVYGDTLQPHGLEQFNRMEFPVIVPDLCRCGTCLLRG